MKLKYVDKIKSNISITASKKTSNLLDGLYRSIFKGRSLDFDDLREYVLGDNSKDIDWKSSIRHGSLLVRRYVALKRHNIAFVVDTGSRMLGQNMAGEEKRETVFYTLGTLAYLVNKNGDDISMTYNKDGKIYQSKFRNGLANLEMSLTEVEKYLVDDNPYTVNDYIDNIVKSSKRKMIIIVISDIVGLREINDDVLKKAVGAHDLLFINIDDGSMFGEGKFDLDIQKNIPKIISKNNKLKVIEQNERKRIVEENFKRLSRFRITGITISGKKEIVYKLIELLERHNHAVGR